VLGKPVYQIRCVSAINHAAMGHKTHPSMNHLADAITGKLRGALSEQEAIAVAKERYNGSPVVKSVEYLTNTNGHHEYRESPLPAYAISFENPCIPRFMWLLNWVQYKNSEMTNGVSLIFSGCCIPWTLKKGTISATGYCVPSPSLDYSR